jgi:peptidoglycan-N-acetylglucosamine deacetylase
MLTHKNVTAIFGMTFLLLLLVDSFYYPIPLSLFILLGFFYFGIIAWGSSQINSNYHITALCHGNQAAKEIAITFDDGPDKAITPEVLAILKKHEVKATFFCIGKKIAGNENLIQQIVADGHIVANHSFSHSYFFDFFGTAKITNELEKTQAELEQIIHKKSLLFRPPYGVTTPAIANSIEKLKLTCIGWNVRSLDTIEKNESKLVQRVTSQLNSGSIVLFHDTNKRVAKALEQTIEYCHLNGFKIVSLDQLLKIEPYA